MNVILDVLCDRAPHFDASAAVWTAVENGLVKGFLAAHAVTTIYFIVHKQLGAKKTARVMNGLLRYLGLQAWMAR